MTIKILSATLLVVLTMACKTSSVQQNANSKGFTRFVNPFVGTTPLTDSAIVGFNTPKGWRPWSGLTYPGSSLPNAMVQLSPVTTYGSGAGYQYEDSTIIGFTHTNKGHWNLCNIPVLPVTGTAPVGGNYASRYTHDRESAAPGFYQVYLSDYDVDVRLTSTLRCGFHQYTFNGNGNRNILFDLGRANNQVRGWQIEQVGNNTLQGYQDVGNDKIYFFATLNSPIAALEKKDENKRNGKAMITLAGSAKVVELKIGLSFVGVENARLNLQKEVGEQSFETVYQQANNTWENLLSTIAVTGGTKKQTEMFYSSLYRTFLWPALRSDVNGEYTDAKNKTVTAAFNYYTVPSLWDTYRNKLVLLAMVSPKVAGDVISSLKDMGDKNGYVPSFFHGDHAASFVTGSYLRGVDNFDVEGIYKLLLKNAFVEGRGRPHLNEYMQKGYISTPEIENPHVETKAKAGVSKTLEYAYDDYSLALLAQKLSDTANYRKLMERSAYYKNVFDASSRFMRGRLADGNWVQNFNPQYPYYEYMYREGNAWQLSFYVPHDMQGLIKLYGGSAGFESKLDSLFTVPWNPKHIARNVETMIGQYCHGNQPDHEAPFAYYFINKPEKSQKMIDFILNERYGMGAQGLDLSGMDDAGEMSAWYVCSAMGLYPYIASSTDYLVTVPLFDKVEWKLNNGKKLLIQHKGNGRNLQYITVNGNNTNSYFVPHSLFNSGGEINVITR